MYLFSAHGGALCTYGQALRGPSLCVAGYGVCPNPGDVSPFVGVDAMTGTRVTH